MANWTKYNYLCIDCDALIEVTSQFEPFTEPSCICDGEGIVLMLGQEDATVSENDVTDITPTKVVKINSNPYN
jgi:hypothetical protein